MTVFRQITLLLLLLAIADPVTVYGAQVSAEDQPLLVDSADPSAACHSEEEPADDDKDKIDKERNSGSVMPRTIFMTVAED